VAVLIMRALPWTMAGLLLAGCGDLTTGDGVFPDQDAFPLDGGRAPADGGPGRGDAGGVDAGVEVADPLGTWALFVEDRKCLSAVGTSVENIIWSWYRVEVVDVTGAPGSERRALRQTVSLCSQELSPLIGGLRTIVPDALVASLPAHEWSALLLGAAAGSGYVSEEFVDLWGAEGVGPDEPVPTDPEDPRVIDLDDDGAPGVTFVVGNSAGGEACRVHVVQRTRLNLDGAVLDSAHLAGSLRSVVDKSVLSATSALCNSGNELVPSPTPSRFWMVRVDGSDTGGFDLDLDGDGAVGCDEIVTGEAVLSSPSGVMRDAPTHAVCRD
jgi:hypothetical protein